MIATFLGMDLVGLPLLLVFGLVNPDSLTLFAILLAPLLAGIVIGNRLIGRFSEKAVRRAVLILLIAMSLAIGAQGLGWLPEVG